MKRLFLLLLVCSIGALQAQQDTLKIIVDGQEVIILADDMDELSQVDLNKMLEQLNSDAQQLTTDYQNRVNELIRQYKNGEITEDAFNANMEMEAERFQIKMETMADDLEAWSDEYEEQWEEWDSSQSELWLLWADSWRIRMNDMEGAVPPPPPPPFPNFEEDHIDDDDYTWEWQWDWDEYRKKDKRRTQVQGDIHFGWNGYLQDGGMVSDDPAELRPWQSTLFVLGMAGKTRVGGENSIFHVRYGFQFNWQHFRLKGNNVIYKDAVTDGITFGPITDTRPEIENVSFSSFNAAYLDVPLLLVLDFSKRRMDKGISVAAGGYGGVRVGQKRDIIYDDFNNDPVKERSRNNFYMNQWRYGLMAQIGLHAFKITGKYDLSSFFREDRATPNYNIWSLTFGFTF